ncbi:hypothetical protein F5Y05DRAFT_149601 [Hypoxylon sp. FL0543]|nr:hypothetical protein F5Y05DRAFT_149601 [Hypoxylon sp. FL0543]
MHVPEFAEDHPYWSTLQQSQINNINAKAIDAAESRYPRNAHVHTTDNGKPPSQELRNAGQKAKGRRQKGMSVAARSRGVSREKRYGLADPVVWDAINRTLDQQRRLSTMVIPEEPVVWPIQPSRVPSRTSSQRKALNRFTRQLEKYADVAGAVRNPLIMTPTETESKVSYHTVQPLLPYRRQFQEAGLAVTSAEQSRGSPLRPRRSRELINHLPRNVMAPTQMTAHSDGQGSASSEQFSSSSGSYVVFTAADHPIEPLPSPKFKSTQKSPSKGKRGILPWLKKKPPTTEARTYQTKPQQIWPHTRHRQGGSQQEIIYPPNVRDPRKSRAFRDQLVQVPDTTPTRSPRRSTQFSADVNKPQKLPSRASSLVEDKQGGRGLRQRPVHLQATPEVGTLHTGLRRRDTAVTRPPRPETIEEEKENSPRHSEQTTSQTRVQIYPLIEPRVTSVPNSVDKEKSRGISPGTTPSTVPSLPYPARYASARPSSLERALEEVSQQLEQMERETDKSAQLHNRPQALVEKTNEKESHSSPRHSIQHASQVTPSRPPRLDEEVIFVNQKMPLVEHSEPKPEKALPSSPKPIRAPPTPPRKRSQPDPPKVKALPTAPQAENVLNELDVFFDYDDAGINDRDVIKGLQVAIHAAADNVYDAVIRQRTGLRIRRFLADLMAVGEVDLENSAEQRARERTQQAQKTYIETRL